MWYAIDFLIFLQKSGWCCWCCICNIWISKIIHLTSLRFFSARKSCWLRYQKFTSCTKLQSMNNHGWFIEDSWIHGRRKNIFSINLIANEFFHMSHGSTSMMNGHCHVLTFMIHHPWLSIFDQLYPWPFHKYGLLFQEQSVVVNLGTWPMLEFVAWTNQCNDAAVKLLE